jgi:hypothetical protein
MPQDHTFFGVFVARLFFHGIEGGDALHSFFGGSRPFAFIDIPRSRQNPKFVVIDDPEIVGDLIAEGFPFVG